MNSFKCSLTLMVFCLSAGSSFADPTTPSPETLSGCMKAITTTLSEISYDPAKNLLIGRQDESQLIASALQRGKSIHLHGDSGVGRFSTVVKTSKTLEDQYSFLEFDWQLAATDIADTQGRWKELQKTIDRINKEDKKPVLILPEAQNLFRTEQAYESNRILASKIEQLVKKGEIQIIAKYPQGVDIPDSSRIYQNFESIEIKSLSPAELMSVVSLEKLKLEKKYGITITSDAIKAVLQVTRTNMADRASPGREISVLEHAAILAKMASSDTPLEIKKINDEVSDLEAIIEQLSQAEHNNDLVEELQGNVDRLKQELTLLEPKNTNFENLNTELTDLRIRQNELKEKISELKAKVGTEDMDYDQLSKLGAELQDIESKIESKSEEVAKMASDQGLVQASVVDPARIVQSASQMLQRPVHFPGLGNRDISDFEAYANQRVKGQERMIHQLTGSLEVFEKLKGPNQKAPFSVVLVGPSGSGKTMLGQTLSEFSGMSELPPEIDLSQYAEIHTRSNLVGGAKTYVGYEEGKAGTGELGQAILANPNGTIILNELDKAHPEIITSLMEILDTGVMTAGNGMKIDASGVRFVFTSNIAGRYYDPNHQLNVIRNMDDAEAMGYKPEFDPRSSDYSLRVPLENGEKGGFTKEALKLITTEIYQVVDHRTGRPFFRTEVAARFTGGVIIADPLTSTAAIEIAKTNLEMGSETYLLKDFVDKAAGLKPQFLLSDSAKDFIAENLDPSTNGRSVKAILNNHFRPALIQMEKEMRAQKVKPIPGSSFEFVINNGKVSITVKKPESNETYFEFKAP